MLVPRRVPKMTSFFEDATFGKHTHIFRIGFARFMSPKTCGLPMSFKAPEGDV